MMKGVAAKLMDINKVKERSNKAIKRYKHSERSEGASAKERLGGQNIVEQVLDHLLIISHVMVLGMFLDCQAFDCCERFLPAV